MNTRHALVFIFCTVALDVLASFLHRRRDHARGRAKAFGSRRDGLRAGLRGRPGDRLVRPAGIPAAGKAHGVLMEARQSGRIATAIVQGALVGPTFSGIAGLIAPKFSRCSSRGGSTARPVPLSSRPGHSPPLLRRRRWSLRRGGDLPPEFCELADQPIRFQRILEPRLSPTGVQAFPDNGKIHFLPVKIEQRQLTARLGQAPPQINQFAYCWKIDFQSIIIKRI